jgi:KipI family sensor histidine kinase inhibitor
MRFSALGDSAIVAECGEGISPQTLQRVRDFANAVERARIEGVVDIVPAFVTVTVFYLPAKMSGHPELPYQHLLGLLTRIAGEPRKERSSVEENHVEIPVCYGGEHGPDLPTVAQHAGRSVADVISLHSDASYLVHAIGFSPGFPYLGGLPAPLHMPRLATPRVRVEAGSVGIGGAQTGVYPLPTPGGWQLIGRTPLRLFDFAREKPALLRIGDRVKFCPITREEFLAASLPATVAAPTPGKCQPTGDIYPGVRVLRAGMLTTVQDLGRLGHRAEGVPLSGAADAVALRVANWLVGNAGDAAALEFTLVGPELEFTTDAVIALGGATFDGVPEWQPVQVTAGTCLKFGAARTGCRGYLAIAGGFKTDSVLGSRSTYLRAGFGGWEGRALRDGDQLFRHEHEARVGGGWHVDERILPRYSPTPTVRVVRGAQADDFRDGLLAGEFAVTARSDRMGLRLSGPPLLRSATPELLSSAVAPGTIQVPADGQPILLLADAQTIGGYPQAAHVITVDLPLVAQLKPGDRVRFREISLEEAQKLLLAREHALAILHEGLTQKFR